MGYTHRQTEGHLLLTINYLVRRVLNTSLTGHVLIVQQIERALLLVVVCARSGRGGLAVSRLMFQPAKTSSLQRHQRVMMSMFMTIGYDKPSKLDMTNLQKI